MRVLLLGAGRVGVRHGEAIRECNDVTLGSVVDKDLDRATALAREFGARVFEDLESAVLAQPSVDAVINCLPHNLHYQTSLTCLRHGLHLLLEKPMCFTIEEADDLIATAEAEDVKLMVGFVHRYRQELREAKATIEKGELGQILAIHDRFYKQAGERLPGWVWEKAVSGGGILMFVGIHALDRIRWLVGKEAVDVTARVRPDPETDVCEEGVWGCFSFGDGVLGTVQADYVEYPTPSKWETLIFGTHGMLHVETGKQLEYSSPALAYTRAEYRYSNFVRQLREFTDAVKEDRPPEVNGNDGRQSLAMALAMYSSARLGRVVSLREQEG